MWVVGIHLNTVQLLPGEWGGLVTDDDDDDDEEEDDEEERIMQTFTFKGLEYYRTKLVH